MEFWFNLDQTARGRLGFFSGKGMSLLVEIGGQQHVFIIGVAGVRCRSLDLPSTEGVDTLAQELAKLQDNGKRRIAFLGSRHVPVVDIHLIELIARSLAEEGHSIVTSGSQGVNAAVIRAVLDINPSLLTVLLPQSLDRQLPEIKNQLERVL